MLHYDARLRNAFKKELVVTAMKEMENESIEEQLMWGVYQRHLMRREIYGSSDSGAALLQPSAPSTTRQDSYHTFHSFSDNTCYDQRHFVKAQTAAEVDLGDHSAFYTRTPVEIAKAEIYKSVSSTAEPTLELDQLSPELRSVFESTGSPIVQAENLAGDSLSKKFLKKQNRIAQNKEIRKASRELQSVKTNTTDTTVASPVMTSKPPAEHKPLVVGRTKPPSASTPAMADTTNTSDTKTLNNEIEKNLATNTSSAAPAEDGTAQPKKKEKAPKQPKPPKATPAAAPLSPALLDLRVGHILRAINHPNADSLYVSTIAMGDPEGTEHTQTDEETGKVVRTVCSGLNGLVPLAEMQDRKIIVVANLKPVNMRSIKSAAMVLAASPVAEEGADPHAADRIVELVSPPEGSEAGDRVYFEGWEYGEGKGPEKQLNPKKKQWEGIQPGFYTSEDLVVGFNASKSEVEGDAKGDLVVEGKGKCTVKTLKGAVVR